MESKLIIGKRGTKCWKNEKGQYHREDGPAIEYSTGTKIWHINGKRHREDGPAIEHTTGHKEWYYHGKYIDCSSQTEFERIINLLIFE